MKKLSVASLIFVIILSLLTACGKGDTASSDKPETTGPDVEDSQAGTVEMGELTLVIGSETITLPVTIEDFMALGWETAYEESATNLEGTFNPKEYTTIYLVKGEYHATSLVANLTDDVITVSQGTIVGFDEVGYYNMLELPNGIVQGVSSMEDIIAAYGEPDEVDPWGKFSRYYMEGFIVSVWEYEESGLLGQIKIRFQGWEDFDRIVY